MRLIREQDFYETRIVSVVTPNDFFTLNLLYQPIMGSNAFALYMTLVNTNKLTSKQPFSHDSLSKMLNLTTLEIVNALKKLEALDLLRTYVNSNQNINFYYYEIYSPKSAKAFFEDKIFPGLLTSVLGKKLVNNLAHRFEVQNAFDNNAKEITASFAEVFNPNYDSEYFNNSIDTKNIGKKKTKRKQVFDLAKLSNILQNDYQIILQKALSNQEIDEISQYVNVFYFNEETMGELVARYYDYQKEFGQRVDLNAVKDELINLNKYEVSSTKRLDKANILSGDSDTVELLNKMEVLPSLEFLRSYMNGADVPNSEKRLLADLATNFHLTNGVINAIVYYVMMNNQKQLPRALVEKIAGTISRLGYKTAINCYDYFETYGKNDKKTTTKKVKQKDIGEVNKQEISDITTEEELRRLLEKFNG